MQSPNSGDSRTGRSGVRDEFDWIEDLRARFEDAARAFRSGSVAPAPGDLWIGDDAAAVTLDRSEAGGRSLLATDLVVAGVHVDLDLCSLADVGFKALMVTVSDLAAMGGRAQFALASIAAPEGTDLDEVGDGLAEASTLTECVVVGGDLSRAPVLTISIAVVGALRGAARFGPLLRSGAKPGDRLFVTGPLGASAAGLRQLRHHRGEVGGDPALGQAYRRPMARQDEGEAARRSGASAAIDISDGLAADSRHVARASGVGLALESLPVSAGATYHDAVQGGEEYELLIATGAPDQLIKDFAAARLRPPIPIGTCTDRVGEDTLDGVPLPRGGWRHQF